LVSIVLFAISDPQSDKDCCYTERTEKRSVSSASISILLSDNEPMGAFYVSAGIQFASILFLGLPIALALIASDRSRYASGWLLLSPALGATVYFSAGTILHSFGLKSAAVFWGMVGLAAICLVLLSCLARRPRLHVMLGGIGLCFAGAALAIAVNSADLLVAGLDYFPLTNDDTFSYLGLIDQLRSVGWIEPRMSYPGGFSPLIDHAATVRAPSAIFAADFGDILGLHTHSAFFLSQRIALPIIALGATSIVMLVTRSLTASMLCFASLIFGNVLLHQILQHFNSSTMGTVIAPVIIAAAIWTFRAERSENEMIAGCALAGWACGAMATTSMEAHPFYLVAFGAIAIVPIVSSQRWMRMFKGAAVFTALYLVSSFPFLLNVWPALIGQFLNAGHGHPGDWIAASGFLMQATGVTLTTADKLTAYPLIPRIAAMAVLGAVIISIIVLGWSAKKTDKTGAVIRSDLLALITLALLVAIFQTILYVRGSGYSLLKITDYFVFVGAIIVSVAAFQIGLTKSKIVGGMLVCLIGAYCAIAFIEKRKVLGLYRDRTALMPLPSAYELDPHSARATVYPDLSAEPLNLFLYQNRYGPNRIAFRASETNRFNPIGAPDVATPRQIARLFHVGALGATVADITYAINPSSIVMRTAPLEGQAHLVLPNPRWLAPAGGSTVDLLRRWLSVSGKFVLYGPLAQGQRTLEVHLAAGPDIRPDNRIELYISGELLLTLGSSELPRQIAVTLPALSGIENEGEIRIVGPAGGIHQLSVSMLTSVAR
jgi:hypothetical protein